MSAADTDEIPIIDVRALWSTDITERLQLAAEIREACTQVGFFYIKNHGVPEDQIAAVQDLARSFFALPDRTKEKYAMKKSKRFRGFMPLFAEQGTGSEFDGPSGGGLSESFDLGYEIALDPERSSHESLPLDKYSLYGGNQWPDDDLPGFRKVYLAYFAEMMKLSRRMMRSFALALGQDESFFDSKITYPGVVGRLMHYPAQPVEGEVIEGLGAHTDYDCFTILPQDDVPALQVRNARGEWTLIRPIPGTMVVNIADCLSIWSNKTFKSTIHRVTNLTGKERYSIPFFFRMDYDTTVEVLPNWITEDKPACNSPFKAGEWVLSKITKAYVSYEGDEYQASIKMH